MSEGLLVDEPELIEDLLPLLRRPLVEALLAVELPGSSAVGQVASMAPARCSVVSCTPLRSSWFPIICWKRSRRCR